MKDGTNKPQKSLPAQGVAVHKLIRLIPPGLKPGKLCHQLVAEILVAVKSQRFEHSQNGRLAYAGAVSQPVQRQLRCFLHMGQDIIRRLFF